MSASELENYKLQLQQVEAALMAEPDNEELLKLKEDLVEIIELQEELVIAGAPVTTSTSALRGQAGGLTVDISKWKVGDRCMASTKNGQRFVAVIDGISQDRAAITFTGNGVKDMVHLSDLSTAPVEEKKNYIFQSAKSGGGPKKEWQLERERRKLRAQKKEQRKKTIDEAKEQEKSKWKNFTAKASQKHLKGLKRVEATSSAADGGKEAPERRAAISSRKDHSLGRTQRGNMDSLF